MSVITDPVAFCEVYPPGEPAVLLAVLRLRSIASNPSEDHPENPGERTSRPCRPPAEHAR